MYSGYAPGMTVTPLVADKVGEHGWIERKDSDSSWIIRFRDGDEWALTEAELDNRAHFRITPPSGLRQCLLRVKYGYEHQQLMIGDDPMIEAMEEISLHTGYLLELVDQKSGA